MTKQEAFDWVQEFPGAVTVCDRDGVILAMNDKSVRTFESDGGAALIGSNLFGCHPEPALSRVEGTARRRASQHLHNREKGRQEADLSIALVHRGCIQRLRRALAGDSLRDAAFCPQRVNGRVPQLRGPHGQVFVRGVEFGRQVRQPTKPQAMP